VRFAPPAPTPAQLLHWNEGFTGYWPPQHYPSGGEHLLDFLVKLFNLGLVISHFDLVNVALLVDDDVFRNLFLLINAKFEQNPCNGILVLFWFCKHIEEEVFGETGSNT
jgi:hypothetical protein